MRSKVSVCMSETTPWSPRPRSPSLICSPLSDRIARIEGLISAKTRTLQEIPVLQAGGLFSPRVATDMKHRAQRSLGELREELEHMRGKDLNLKEERRLLYLRCFGEEKTLYYQMFSKGHLGERTYRNLAHSIEACYGNQFV